MKLSLTGFLFELDQVNFRIGAVMQATMTLPLTEVVVIDQIRTIKHYDRFFRRPPKKNAQGVAVMPEEKPKKLVEAHFIHLKPENRLAIERYLMALTVERMKHEK